MTTFHLHLGRDSYQGDTSHELCFGHPRYRPLGGDAARTDGQVEFDHPTGARGCTLPVPDWFVHRLLGRLLQPGEVLPVYINLDLRTAARDTAPLCSRFLADVQVELAQAERSHGPMGSLHEAWAVILEEVDELWDLCRLKRSERDPVAVRDELIQIAAMAWRAARNLGLEEPVLQSTPTLATGAIDADCG